MSPKLLFCLPLLLGAAAAQADGPATAAAAPSETATAAPAEAAKEPLKKRTADPKADPAAATNGPTPPGGDVKMSGMSILGNEDSPKSLVLVPWKSSQLGDMPSVSRLLDASKQPVDKDVFLRELSYYEFRAGTK